MLLSVQDLQVTYRTPGQKPVAAVRGVSFDINAGESFGIVGESGCGKSSLARAIIGLHPVSSGTLRYEDTPLNPQDKAKSLLFRGAVQMVFQDAVGSLNPRMTVQQTLAEVLGVHEQLSAPQIVLRISELLDRVGLPETILDAYPREMSGGQCQRVSLARCLACNPRLIIADEPVSALDVSVQARILNLLRRLQRELNLAVLLISHDLAVVRNICDRVAVMQNGVFVEKGLAEQVLNTPQHPYTRELLAAVPDIGRALRRLPSVTQPPALRNPTHHD